VRLAYVDSSCLVAIAFGEPGAKRVAASLSECDRLLSTNLLEAEFRSALAREGAGAGEGGDLLSWISWYLPDHPLSAEIGEVLRLGHVRGADLFHLAAALRLRRDFKDLLFATMDRRQGETARALGFAVLPPDRPRRS
jgi:predicted nucleic acid-binding protein